jgi:NAD(P)-dependent dehydrogenase (short-subunit alcohol dehydrogenase family)
VAGFTENTAFEYSDKRIRINCVAPGFINTPLPGATDKKSKEGLSLPHPPGRLGKPDEVAALVMWLSSEKASYATGGSYPIEGGYLSN